MRLKILKTRDGSDTLYNPELDETYHSHHGALTESKHVFVENGLAYYTSQSGEEVATVLEIGFGSGLNAVLTCLWAIENQKTIHYHTLEPFPLDYRLAAALNYFETSKVQRDLFLTFHRANWGETYRAHNYFHLIKHRYPLEEFQSDEAFNVVYFDAFAPEKQPALWSLPNLKKVYDFMRIKGVLTSYCAKGEFKRNLKSLSFQVEKLAGPPGGKREMVRAAKS